MGHSCTPHLHLDLTGWAHALFKVTTGSTFVLFSKDCPLTHWVARNFAFYMMRKFMIFSPLFNLFPTSNFSFAAKAHREPDNGCDWNS